MFENPLEHVNKFNSYLAKQIEEEKQRKLKQQAYNEQQKQALSPTFSKKMVDASDWQQYENAGIRPLTAKEKMNINAPYSKSERFPTLTKQDENFIMSKAGGDPVKATEVYGAFMEAKSARDFLNAREGQRNELVYKASQEKDPEAKSRYELIIKGSQLADIARRERLKEGFNDVAKVGDEQLLNNLLKTPEAQEGFTSYLNGKISLDDMAEIIDPGYTTRNKPVVEENKEVEEVDGTILGDIAGGIAKSGTATAEIGANIGDWLGYNIIKAIMGEEKANEVKEKLGDSFGETIDKTLAGLGVDQESFAYKAGKFGGDTAQIAAGGSMVKAIPTVGKGIQAVDALGKTSKGMQIGTSIAKGAIQGAADTAMYDAIANKELVSGKELAVGGAIGGATTALGLGISKAADVIKSKLQLSGTLNVKDLRKAAKTLGAEKDVDNVAQWMLDNNVVGGHEKMVDKLAAIADDSFITTNKALAKSKTLHKVEAAEKALAKIKNALGGDEAIGGLETEFDDVTKLLNKSKRGLTLADLNKVQKLQSEYLPNFTISNTVADTAQAKGNANLYMKVKSFIEKTAEKEGMGDIKNMKKTTQIANLLKEAIGKKMSNESARSLVNLYGPSGVGVVGGAIAGPDPIEDPMGFLKYVAGGAIAGGLVQNKAAQSYLAKGLNKLAPQEASAFAQMISGLTRGGASEIATNVGDKE